MTLFVPPNIPPRIPNPKKDAERRARMLSAAITVLFWIAIAVPVLFTLMAYGYSDQAPEFLRKATITLDGAFGSPLWELLKPGGAK